MKESITISTDKALLNLSVIEDFLTNKSYWAKGRSRKVIEKSIANSMCFGVYNNEEQQIGFARVLTDFAVFAWIMDVFILEEYRKRGLGKLLMNTIMNHPELKDLPRWGLGTEDAQGLYEQFGFKILAKPENRMEKIKI